MNLKYISDKQELLASLSNGTIVITPNNRLSNQLLQDAFVFCQQKVLDKPRCLPYQAFLQKLFHIINHTYPQENHPMLLSALQTHAIWQNVLSDHGEPESEEGLLEAVLHAASSCRQWQASVSHESFDATPQTRQFRRWVLAFQKHLEELHAITTDELADYVLPYLSNLELPGIIWASFNEFTPQQQALQKTFLNQGCPQYQYDLMDCSEALQSSTEQKPQPKDNQTTLQYPSADEQDELYQMLAWVKKRLAKGDTRIGVVVPELKNLYKPLLRLIQRHLPIDSYNISLGEPLSQHPLIAHALSFISLDLKTIHHDTAQLLLRSPYLKGSRHEFMVRSDLLQNSPLLKESRIDFGSWIKALQPAAPLLSTQLSLLEEYPQTASAAQWVSLFKTRLNTLGFPGDYSLSSACYQHFQQIERLFSEFIQLTAIKTTLNRTQAFSALRYLANHTVFQIKKPTTPVVILGLLEASGCTFDSLWTMGMDSQCLPQKTQLSAFIPIELQRALDMPKSSPDKELRLAKLNLARLNHGSQHTVFSYSKLLGDTPNLPSPLIEQFPFYTEQSHPTPTETQLKPMDECYNVPLKSQEKVSGGTALLGNQAKCPFRAFASHRLHARGKQQVTTGPDALERGQIIHRILEKLWLKLKNQTTLHALPQAKLDVLIHEAIEEAITHNTSHRRHSFPALIQEVENNRLKTLVDSCLEWEKQRPDFAILGVEQTFTFKLSELDFTIRVDRLDKVGEKVWIIDYKTTMPTVKPWASERPEDPQLLLYALLDERINALLFLQLKAGRLTVGGLSEQDFELEGLSALKKGEVWSEMQQKWREQLTLLAEEFQQGHCIPTPARTSLCQQCDFPTLCRVHTSTQP